MSKYNSKKTVVDGISFDSKDESKFYLYLKDLKAKGLIDNFELQPKFLLQEGYKYRGKTRRSITYKPDFTIYYLNGDIEYIDIKSLGTVTQASELRRKLFEYKYNDLKLTWVCRSLKYSSSGWIEYEELKKIRRQNKKN